MANFQKYGKSAIGHLAAHYERWKEKDRETGREEYVKFGNQDIDTSRTHLNYNLGPQREIGQVEFIQQRISEVRCLKRDDVKVLCCCVVTLPKEDADGEAVEYTEDQIRDFFDEAYCHLRDLHGEENVVSCYVHMDETTPHMHFAFVPVVEDKKRGDLKVSAKEAVNQPYLRRFHVELQRSMDKRFGEGFFPILNGNTEGGNRTIMQLKAERAAEDLGVAQVELYRAEIDLEETKGELNTAKKKIAAAEKDLWNTLSKFEEARSDLNNTSAMVEKLEADRTVLEFHIEDLKAEKHKLENEKSTLEKDLPELREQVREVREELRIAKEAIKEKQEEGLRVFGSMDEYHASYVKKQESEKKAEKVSLLEKFIELPWVKPLWERFILDQTRRKDKTKKIGEKDISD